MTKRWMDVSATIIAATWVISAGLAAIYWQAETEKYRAKLIDAEERYKEAINWPDKCSNELEVCREANKLLIEGIKIEPPATQGNEHGALRMDYTRHRAN